MQGKQTDASVKVLEKKQSDQGTEEPGSGSEKGIRIEKGRQHQGRKQRVKSA